MKNSLLALLMTTTLLSATAQAEEIRQNRYARVSPELVFCDPEVQIGLYKPFLSRSHYVKTTDNFRIWSGNEIVFDLLRSSVRPKRTEDRQKLAEKLNEKCELTLRKASSAHADVIIDVNTGKLLLVEEVGAKLE